MAQTRTPQRQPGRPGLNREQTRRGMAAPNPGGRAAAPALAAAGGRGGRRGVSLLGYLREIRSELRKVAWPTNREVFNLTVVVLALSVALGLFLGGVDFIFQELFKLLLGLTGNGG